MKRKFIITIHSFVICSLVICHSALAVDGTSFDPSQNLYSARQLGLGGVAIAFSDDASGVLANPACLSRVLFPQLVGASRKIVLEESQSALAGWAVPTDWGVFGLGYSGLSAGGSFPTKLDPSSGRMIQDPSREAISYGNSVLALSYAKNFNAQLALGGSLKMFNQSLSGGLSSKAAGTGFDLAAVYFPNNWLTVGANLQNLLEANLAWEGGASDKVGGFHKIGCKINILGPAAESWREYSQTLVAGLDFGLPHNTLAASSLNLGLEYFPVDKISLRTGLAPAGLTLGVGVTNGGFRFDYAYAANSKIPGDTPHYFSLAYVGERVKTSFLSLKRKEANIKFLQPKDRSLTDLATITIEAEAAIARVLNQQDVYTVTGLSVSAETYEVTKLEQFAALYVNGQAVAANQPLISVVQPLGVGRNILQIIGHGTPEAVAPSRTLEVFVGSSETKVLRIRPFSDVPLDHWAMEPIYLSSTLGLVKGYPDDSFRPDKGITRAELIALLVRTLPVALDNLTITAAAFSDVPESFWAAKFVAYGNEKQYVTGYPDGSFQPNKTLTRAEGVVILARYADLPPNPEAKSVFPDLADGFWANKYIAPAKAGGLLEYLTGKNFEPSTPFTRAEATEVLYRTQRIQSQVNQWWETGIVSAQQSTTTEATTMPVLVSTPEAAALTPTTTLETPSLVTPEAQPSGVTTSEAQ